MLPPPLLRLPIELHRDIIDKLAFQDRVRLTLTCRYFLSIIKPPTYQDLLAVEISSWAVSSELYTCKFCIRLRHLRRYADDMRKGKRARHGVDVNTRFCLDCGVEQHLYPPGTTVTVMGQTHSLCMRCKIFPVLNSSELTLKGCSSCTRAVQKMGAKSCGDDEQYDSEDDWSYSTRSFVDGKHSGELHGAYPDF